LGIATRAIASSRNAHALYVDRKSAKGENKYKSLKEKYLRRERHTKAENAPNEGREGGNGERERERETGRFFFPFLSLSFFFFSCTQSCL